MDGVDNASIYKIKKRNCEITKYAKLVADGDPGAAAWYGDS